MEDMRDHLTRTPSFTFYDDEHLLKAHLSSLTPVLVLTNECLLFKLRINIKYN
jgi:hypothetical protein